MSSHTKPKVIVLAWAKIESEQPERVIEDCLINTGDTEKEALDGMYRIITEDIGDKVENYFVVVRN